MSFIESDLENLIIDNKLENNKDKIKKYIKSKYKK